MRTQIVVPCFNEELRLDRAAFVEFANNAEDIGLILVDDGSRDGTLAALESIREQCPARIRVLSLEKNQGKAEAVRRGVLEALEAGAEYVGYWDADLATPLIAIPEFVRVLSDNPVVDVVLGARVLLLGRTIDRKPLRHYLGRVFATAASITLNLPAYDTQCGAKLLRAGPVTRGIFAEPFGSRWIFDVELLARYLTRGGTSRGLYEHAVLRWMDVGGSKVRPIDFLRAGRELIAIYRNYALDQLLRPVVVPLTSMFSLYTIAGALGTVGHYVTMVALVEAFRTPPTYATVAGAAVGAAINYFVNYHMTFGSRAKHRSTLPKFALIAVLGMAISGLGVRAAAAVGIHYVLAQALCTIAVLLVGFVLNRFWTFAGERAPRALVEPVRPSQRSAPSAAPEAQGLAASRARRFDSAEEPARVLDKAPAVEPPSHR